MTTLPLVFNTRPLRLAAATLVLAISGGLALSANAAPPSLGQGHGHGGAMLMGAGHIERMLDVVNASPEQRSQIKAITSTAQADLRAQRLASRSVQEQMMQIFTQPNVDARAAESLRQQMLAQHDQSSKRVMQALLDTSRVLTPDQRKQLGEQMVQRRAKMERHRNEHHTPDQPAAR